MKILVTGGAGFIGSHVVDLYIDHGHDVIVLDDLSTGHRSNLHPKARFFEMDIRSPEVVGLLAREKPEVINHHAAQMDVRRSVEAPLFDADVNILGSLNLIEAAHAAGVRQFIYISTGGAVYGEPEYLPCDEDHPVNPICQYGASKHTVEHYLYLYHWNYGMKYSVLRYPNVYGPRQDPHGEAGVVAIFLGRMIAGDPVTINGDGEQVRDFVYVGDCARANLLAIQNGDKPGIYNLGSGAGTSVNEVFRVLQSITGYNHEPVHGPPKIGETRRIWLAADKANREWGWRAEIGLRDGLETTAEHFRTKKVPR
jgi:UDP-glucose 4-epimerase